MQNDARTSLARHYNQAKRKPIIQNIVDSTDFPSPTSTLRDASSVEQGPGTASSVVSSGTESALCTLDVDEEDEETDGRLVNEDLSCLLSGRQAPALTCAAAAEQLSFVDDADSDGKAETTLFRVTKMRSLQEAALNAATMTEVVPPCLTALSSPEPLLSEPEAFDDGADGWRMNKSE